MSIGLIKVGNFKNGKHAPVRDFKTVREHLKYIGFRSREIAPGQERFFNGSEDRVDWRKFYEGVEKHKALQHSNTIKIHKVIFSLREKDYEAYRNSGRDYKDIVRNVLKKYEERKDIKLEWIAGRHDLNSHPHCHVVIRAVTKDGPDGKCNRVFLTKNDIEKMKRDFDNEVSRHRVFEREQVPEREREDRGQTLFIALDRQPSHDTSLSMTSLFDHFQRAIEREQQKRALEGERERQQDTKGRDR